MSGEFVLSRQITERFSDQIEESHYGKARAREILSNLDRLVVLASKNLTKADLYLEALRRLPSGRFDTMMDLGNLEDFHTWMPRESFYNVRIPEAPEPYSTAGENALAKLSYYLKEVSKIYLAAKSGLPGCLFATDDDFVITDDEFRFASTDVSSDYQPGGAIKSVGGQRVSKAESIAMKYSEAVELFGESRDLRKLGLGDERSLPVLFEYYVVAGLLRPDGAGYDGFSTSLKVPGYLLTFNEERFFEGYPVVWVPSSPELRGRTMGQIVREAVSRERGRDRDSSSVGIVLGPNLQKLKGLLGSGDTSGWEREGAFGRG